MVRRSAIKKKAVGGIVTKDCTSCVKLYRQLEQEREKEKHERSI
jgi:hypothetical protein